MFYLWILAISCFLGGIGTVVIFQEEKRERKEEHMRERNEVSKKKPYYIPPERMMELRHYCKQVSDLEKELNEITSLAQWSARIPRGSAKTDPTVRAVLRRDQLIVRLGAQWSAETDLHEKLTHDYECDWTTITIIEDILAKHIRTGERYDTQVAKLGYSPISKAKYYEYYHWFFYFLDKHRN